MNMRLSFCILLLSVASLCQSQQAGEGDFGCAEHARRVLGDSARVLRFGDFLHIGSIQCLAVIPLAKSRGAVEVRVRRGFVVQKDGAIWRDLLQFEDNVRNPKGFMGVDFIDPNSNFGFAVEVANERSDGTPGFTMYLTYLNRKLEPEGVAIQASWNPKVNRFQEYAPNELDPPDFKPEIAHPPIHKR